MRNQKENVLYVLIKCTCLFIYNSQLKFNKVIILDTWYHNIQIRKQSRNNLLCYKTSNKICTQKIRNRYHIIIIK